jgi:signal recognition particle subunit SEC65
MKNDELVHELPDAALWREIIRRVPDRKKLQAMSWTKLAVIARELGYEEHARAWEASERHGG